jgi:hypothetical protein
VTERWALRGDTSRELLTWRERVIVHSDKGELEFLIIGASAVPCPRSVPDEQTVPLPALPQFAHHAFPLDRRDYR